MAWSPVFKNNIIGFIGIAIILILLGVLYFQERTRMNHCYGVLFYKRAQECGDKCSLRQQLSYYRKAIYHDPNCADAHYQLGVLYRKIGNYQQALQSYKKAAALDQSHFKAYFELGLDCFQQGQPEYATRFFKQAYRFNNNFADLHYYMGRVYEQKREWIKAQWHYMRTISIEEKYFDAHLRLGMIYHLLENDRLALEQVEALRFFRENDRANHLEYFIKTDQRSTIPESK